MSCRRVAVAACLAGLLGAYAARAQDDPWARAQPTAIAAGGTQRHGVVTIATPDGAAEKRAVLRVPAAATWNGALVVGAHGGSGGNNYDPSGKVIGTDETALDDVIGRHALARGFAYASVDRDGIGGTRDGLVLTYAFTDLATAEVRRVARSPRRGRRSIPSPIPACRIAIRRCGPTPG